MSCPGDLTADPEPRPDVRDAVVDLDREFENGRGRGDITATPAGTSRLDVVEDLVSIA